MAYQVPRVQVVPQPDDQASFQVDGRWSEDGGIVSLETVRSGGEPVAGEDTGTTDAILEGGYLVLQDADGRRMYLRRL